MAQFANDTFTETSDTTLASHSPDDGGSWTIHPSYTPTLTVVGADDNLQNANSASGTSAYYHSGTAATADYLVSATLKKLSTGGFSCDPGLAARMSTSANTYYWARWNGNINEWEMYKTVTGTSTKLDNVADTLSTSTDYALVFEVSGTSLTLDVDAVEKLNATDSAITAAGKPGIRFFTDGGAGGQVGLRLDNFSADDPGGGGGISIPIASYHYRHHLR